MMTNGQTITKLQTDKSALEIHATTDYSLFKGIVGNRKIYPVHVARLTAAIAQRNLLAENPILVNEKMQVIDGQHRLAVASANNFTIYYIVLHNGSLDDIRQLNTVKLAWTGYDYLDSYASLEIPAYVYIRQLIEEHGIALSNAVKIAATGQHPPTEFRNGTLRLRDKAEIEDFVQGYVSLKPYAPLRVWNDAEFVGALKYLLTQISAQEFAQHLEEYAKPIEAMTSVKDYLRQFEQIINYRQRKNFLRLF